MKNHKREYTRLLLMHFKSKQKLHRLQSAGKNHHRQNVLDKQLIRIEKKLKRIYQVIERQKVYATSFGVFLMLGTSVKGQVFEPPVSNPFGLVSSAGNSEPTFVDLDGDGDLDLLTGSYQGAFFYYENEGTVNTPDFGIKQINPFNLNSVSFYSASCFADIDDDGDYDLFVGNHAGDIFFIENIGSANTPNFSAPTNNAFGINLNNSTFSFPKFADLDDDGDLDLLVGNDSGSFHFLQNIGSINTPSFASPVLNPFNLSSLSNFSFSDIEDYDMDGDLDILSGDNNSIKYFENIGSSTSPDFNAPITGDFTMTGMYVMTPNLVDLDGDGDLDLMVGSYDGNFTYFENDQCVPMSVSVLNLSDEILGNDGSIDIEVTGGTPPFSYSWSNGESSQDISGLIAGNYDLTITDSDQCSQSITVSILSQVSVEEELDQKIFIYPNPSNGLITIKRDKIEKIELTIIDSRGQIIIKKEIHGEESQINLRDISPGTYLMKLVTESGNFHSSKLLIDQ